MEDLGLIASGMGSFRWLPALFTTESLILQILFVKNLKKLHRNQLWSNVNTLGHIS